MISIHKALAGLDGIPISAVEDIIDISIHKALAGLDSERVISTRSSFISIHKALAGLD